jgi:signal-transduction protein with cAMP-binding, CBS, and nucleotidyltransferase domain
MREVSASDTVRTLMKRPAVQVAPDLSLRNVARIMSEEAIGAVVVHILDPVRIEGDHPVGLLSERDLVRAIADGADPDEEQAGNVMTLDLEFARPNETVRDVVLRMVSDEIRHLPVVEDGVVVAMVSARDALSAIA